MLFSSVIFLFVFLPLTLIFYYASGKKCIKLKNLVLLVFSLFFYAWGEPWFVFIMILCIIMNWFLALLIERNNDKRIKKVILGATIVANLSVLFSFKYLVFVIQNISFLLDININVPNITLPIGISFFTFQALSYVIDIYRKDGVAQKNPLNVALFISLFPQLIAGPIVRYKTIAEQIVTRDYKWSKFSEGMCRFTIGLGKKVLLANNFAIIADAAFKSIAIENLSIGYAWIGALAYTFQIFFDFSGYSDMALGLGKMFGFEFLENFNYPYISKSISEFWRRWHISLGSWFRDYVYIPLGGSRVKNRRRLVFNLFVVWSLTGIWHGANWTFVLWGLMYFVLITCEKVFHIDTKLGKLGYVYTMLFVILGWVIFRSDNLTIAISYIGQMFGVHSSGFIDANVILYLSEFKIIWFSGFLFSMPISKIIKRKVTIPWLENTLYVIFICFIFALSVSYIVKGAYNPFIYFNF